MKKKLFMIVEILCSVLVIGLLGYMLFGDEGSKNTSITTTDIIEGNEYPVEVKKMNNYNLSELEENVIYRFNIPHDGSVRINMDLDENIVFYYKTKGLEKYEYYYKNNIYLSKYSDEWYDHFTEKNRYTDESIIEEFSVMYKKIQNEDLINIIDDGDIYHLQSFEHGDYLDRGFTNYILNETDSVVTIVHRFLGGFGIHGDEEIVVEPHDEKIELLPGELMYVEWGEKVYVE